VRELLWHRERRGLNGEMGNGLTVVVAGVERQRQCWERESAMVGQRW
jgi:hypothetical protein